MDAQNHLDYHHGFGYHHCHAVLHTMSARQSLVGSRYDQEGYGTLLESDTSQYVESCHCKYDFPVLKSNAHVDMPFVRLLDFPRLRPSIHTRGHCLEAPNVEREEVSSESTSLNGHLVSKSPRSLTECLTTHQRRCMRCREDIQDIHLRKGQEGHYL